MSAFPGAEEFFNSLEVNPRLLEKDISKEEFKEFLHFYDKKAKLAHPALLAATALFSCFLGLEVLELNFFFINKCFFFI